MKPAEFLQTLYGDSSGFVALWRSDTKATVWTTPAEPWAVDEFVEASKAKPFDAYFGVALQKERTSGRGDVAGVSFVPALWADIDYAGKPTDASEAHSRKKNYPTADAAEVALSKMPAAPSIRISTGGGVHVYWIFDRPFAVVTEDDRARIAEIVKGWQGMLKARLLKLGGYGLDSTHDLARVMRLPGTPHTKHAGRLVAIEGDASNVVRYSLASLEGFLTTGTLIQPTATVPGKSTPARSPAAKPKGKAIDANLAGRESEPPATKLFNLIQASPEFAKLWEGKDKRASPSEYDMSLANYAINAGWSDKEAAALLVAFAREHFPAHVDKVLRVTNGVQDYLKLTIGKAHDKRQSNAAIEANETAIEELAIEVRDATRAGRDPERSLVLGKLSQFLGVQVVGFRQTGRREEVYSLLIKSGPRPQEIILGNAAAVLSGPERLQSRMMAEARRHFVVTKKLRGEWNSIVAGLVAICEFHDIAEAELIHRVKHVIEQHLERCSGGFHATTADLRVKYAMKLQPFVETEKLYVAGQALKKLAIEVDKPIAGSDLYIGLKQLGFEQSTVQIPSKGTSKSYWCGDAAGYSIAALPDETPLSGDGRDRRQVGRHDDGRDRLASTKGAKVTK